jgi:hypothetical protein
MRPAIATVLALFTQNTNIVFVFAWRAPPAGETPGVLPGNQRIL